jgi:hypothetical protein
MSQQLATVFEGLRELLEKHARGFTVASDSTNQYGLEAPIGPATVRAWGGKVKRQRIPVAWVQVGKAYVSFHLMGVYGNPKLLDGVSENLRKHMQGKSCFNFKAADEALFKELDKLTSEALTGMIRAGFISQPA